ncbi:MAG: phospholipase A [Xanthomonadaceae bacterium]|nr:phospholipase A [Xanthomonadaceae bacterium]
MPLSRRLRFLFLLLTGMGLCAPVQAESASSLRECAALEEAMSRLVCYDTLVAEQEALEDLYFAYTQQAWWQMYNRDDSSPFREVNHEPELGVILRPDLSLLGMQMRQLRLGVVHHSNGRDEPLSRSWNRIFSTVILDRGDFATALRVWYRIPESDARDDNPDITDFYGNFEWYGFYKWRRNTLGIMVRNNLQRNDNRGALQVDWSYPLSERLKFYMQYFNGYGESLIDYDHSTHRLGVGLMLTDWL